MFIYLLSNIHISSTGVRILELSTTAL